MECLCLFFQILNIHKLKRSLWINGTIDSVAIYLFENPISGSKANSVQQPLHYFIPLLPSLTLVLVVIFKINL